MTMANIAASNNATEIPAAIAVDDVPSSGGMAAYTCITLILID